MNNLIFYIILLLGNLSSLSNVSERNQLKKEAFDAYQHQAYKKASILYQKLADATYIVEPKIRLNLANSYFQIKDTVNAKIQYQNLLRTHDNDLCSTALTQLGLIVAENGDSTTALNLFKEALEKKDMNSVARYNYEFLRKKLPQNKLPPPQKPPEQQAQPPSNTPEENSGNVEQSEQKKENLKKIPPETISKEKALQLLEAMKANEIQYIQKSKNTRTNKKNQKDW